MLTKPKLMVPFQIARAITIVISHLDAVAAVYDRRTRRKFGTHRATLQTRSIYAASSSFSREMPRSSNRRINVSSIRLFGHEAPAVIPTTAGPLGNQK